MSNAHTNLTDLAAAQPIVLTDLSERFRPPTIKHIDNDQINLRMLDRPHRVATDRLMLCCHGSLTGFGVLTMVRRVSVALRLGRV